MSNIPHEYIVYQDRPPYPMTGGRSCVVQTKRIPRGRSFNDVRDSLPASMGQMRVVRAYSASSAKSGSGVTCSSAQRSGISGFWNLFKKKPKARAGSKTIYWVPGPGGGSPMSRRGYGVMRGARRRRRRRR